MTRRTPGYRAPVRHKHGSRRHERYQTVDERYAIAEWAEPEADPYEEDARLAREEAWIASSIKREQSESLRRLHAALDEHTPAKVHVTRLHRVVVWELAKELGLSSADLLVIINRDFGEYAPRSTSTIASIVATDIRRRLTTQKEQS